MIFKETHLKGAYIVELDRKQDARGFFARSFCEEEMRRHGVEFHVVQANISHNEKKGTIRGMHYQSPKVREAKFIRCIRGAVWDVIVDMRPDSSTYLQHICVELSADNGKAIYVPNLFAHGNQALSDGAELFYLMDGHYTPGFERAVRYNDPVIGIEWPLPVTVISDSDRTWPLIETKR